MREQPRLCCAPQQRPRPRIQLLHPPLLQARAGFGYSQISSAGRGSWRKPRCNGDSQAFPSQRRWHEDGCRELWVLLGGSGWWLPALRRCQPPPCPGRGADLGQGVLPGQPSAMVPSQRCSQEASRETSLPEAAGIRVGVLQVPAQICAPSLGRAERSIAPEHPLSTFPWGQQCWHLCLEISFHRSLTISCAAAAFAAHVCSSKACPPSANVDQTLVGERHQNKCKQEEKLTDLSLAQLLYRDVIYFGYLNAG